VQPLTKETNPVIESPPEARQLAGQFLEAPTEHLAGQVCRAYAAEAKEKSGEDLILRYLPLVHRIVSQVVTYLKPPLSREDLISAGTIGLIKAAHDFDPTKDAEFKTYAFIRIRGAIIDEMRQWSFAPPAMIRQYDRAQEITERSIEETGLPPTDEQLAEELEIPIEKLYRMFETIRARHFLSIHGLSDEAPALGRCLAVRGEQPFDRLEQEELIEQLTKAIHELPEKQRRIIVLYYHKELTMKQTAQVLEITESRVSQLHAAALFRLAAVLRRWAGAEDANPAG
jgi:RNA polymerase sigma factor for flagellar operon FliA